jgi:peptidoglycan biosynthesis protein MviN/MurJ (putative lipid II flippase)
MLLRYLFVLDIGFAVLGAAMAIGMGVSALLLAWYLDVAPEQLDSMHALLLLTAAYTVTTVAAAAAAWAVHKKAMWHWPAHGIFLVTVLVSYFVSVRMLASQ